MPISRPSYRSRARFNPDAAEPAKPPAPPDAFYPDEADAKDSQASFVGGLNQFQLWNQANGGDPWSMWELNRRGITALPARPNPAQSENSDQANLILLERELRRIHPDGVRVFVDFGEYTIRITGSLSQNEIHSIEHALQDRGFAPLGQWRAWSSDELGRAGAILHFDKAEVVRELSQVMNLEDLKKLALRNPAALPRIEDWFVQVTDDGDRHLFGHVFGHPRHKDGHPIHTSAVERAQGRTILTRTGSAYLLGKPARHAPPAAPQHTARANPKSPRVDQQIVDWLRDTYKNNTETIPELITVANAVRFKKAGKTVESIVSWIKTWMRSANLSARQASYWNGMISKIQQGQYAVPVVARNNPQGMNMVMILGEDGPPMGGEWAEWAQNREGIMHRNPKAYFGKGECTLCREPMFQGDDVEVLTQVSGGKEYKSYVHEECLKRYTHPELFKAGMKKAVRKKTATAKKNHHIPIGGYAKFKGAYLKVTSPAIRGNEQGEFPGCRMFYHGIGAALNRSGGIPAVTFPVIVPDDARWTLGVRPENVPPAILAALEKV